MIRYGLHLRHTSFQAYKQLLEKFPLPSISLLNKIQQGGVNSIKALKILRENGKISNDCILMVDEMYLEKATQYHTGEYVGADDEENLYKGIVAFMIVGLKESIPYIVQAIPEVKFSGEWLADKMSNCIDDLTSAEFCVRGIVTDNHASNVHAFSSLTAIFNSDSHQCINHPEGYRPATLLKSNFFSDIFQRFKSNIEAVVWSCSLEKVLLEISQNSLENTCAKDSFLIKLQAFTSIPPMISGGIEVKACNLIKKEVAALLFSCEFCEISKNTFLYRTPTMAISANNQLYC